MRTLYCFYTAELQRTTKLMPRLFEGYSNELVGRVIVNSWGWSMTIVDFYKVVDETEKTIVVVPLKGVIKTGSLTGTVIPGEPLENGQQSRLQKRAGDTFIGTLYPGTDKRRRLKRHYCTLWDGQPQRFNHDD